MEKEQELQLTRPLPRLTAWGGWESQLTYWLYWWEHRVCPDSWKPTMPNNFC